MAMGVKGNRSSLKLLLGRFLINVDFCDFRSPKSGVKSPYKATARSPSASSKDRRKVLIKKMIRSHINDVTGKSKSKGLKTSRNLDGTSKYETSVLSKSSKYSHVHKSVTSNDSPGGKKVKQKYPDKSKHYDWLR